MCSECHRGRRHRSLSILLLLVPCREGRQTKNNNAAKGYLITRVTVSPLFVILQATFQSLSCTKILQAIEYDLLVHILTTEVQTMYWQVLVRLFASQFPYMVLFEKKVLWKVKRVASTPRGETMQCKPSKTSTCK